jgi:hypothetical protein
VITLYDSIEVSTVPAHAEAVAGYTGGKWPTYDVLVKAFPKAKHLSIAISASEDGECLDIENGDAVISEAPAWFKRQRKNKVARPALYTSLSNIDELVATMNAAGVKRDEYRLWSAHYTYKAHICGPSEGISTAADATQWTDRALGRNLDASLTTDVFWGAGAVPSTYQPNDEINWTKEWDKLRGDKRLSAHLRRLFLRQKMLKRRREITEAAHKTGWSIRNRLYRYKQLQART